MMKSIWTSTSINEVIFPTVKPGPLKVHTNPLFVFQSPHGGDSAVAVAAIVGVAIAEVMSVEVVIVEEGNVNEMVYHMNFFLLFVVLFRVVLLSPILVLDLFLLACAFAVHRPNAAHQAVKSEIFELAEKPLTKYLLLSKLELLCFQQFLRHPLWVFLCAETETPKGFTEFWSIFVEESSKLYL